MKRPCVLALVTIVLSTMGVDASLARAGGSHPPVVIQKDSDFSTCACVSSGSGSTAHPYVIGPLSINSASGDGVFIDGSVLTKSFVLSNLTIAGNGAVTDRGIVLQNISPVIAAEVTGANTSIQTTSIGILVENSSGVILDGGGTNPRGPGISNNGAGTINHNTSGAIDVENSSNITVRGWQMSGNGTDHQPDWVTLDPSLSNWGVGGVRFFKVTNSDIDHNAANNCTSASITLFASSNNTVTENTADYPFTMNILVADGSAYNMVKDNVTGTGDFIGIMVADPLSASSYGASHDNAIIGNVSHSNGPTGNELKANVVPAFLGGIVVLNGAYDNQVMNNQGWASTGADLVWAQAVPASTPIGVQTYPPALYCNVNLSEGGGGTANRNGNVWTGNVVQKSAACIPQQ
jgi:parallel beta-helix repeat protein